MTEGYAPTTTITSLPPAHAGGQQDVVRAFDHFRYIVLVAGRRWGKSRSAVILLLKVALAGGIAWWIWPAMPQGMTGWRLLVAVAGKIPGVEVSLVARSITFPGGGFIQMKSADKPESLRGEGLDLAIFDEYAYMNKATWESHVRPALSDRGGKAVFISSPFGMNHMYELYRMAGGNATSYGYQVGKAAPGWAAFRYRTQDSPHIPMSEIEDAQRTMPDFFFQQEYNANFLLDGAAFFTNLDAVARAVPQTKPSETGWYTAGVDLARLADSSVISISDGSLPVPEQIFLERMTGLNFRTQMDRMVEYIRFWNVSRLSIDSTGLGLAPAEELEARIEDADLDCFVEHVTYTNPIKLALMNDLAMAYEKEVYYILNEVWSLTEHSMMRPVSRPNSLTQRIEAASGYTDDGVNATALDWKTLNTGYFSTGTV